MVQAINMGLIEQALQGFTIPPQPQILQHIQKQLSSQDPDLNRIAALIALDIGTAGFTLKVVNSAFFGLKNKITSIEQACRYLGLNRVIMLARSVLLRFTLEDGRQDAFNQKLWNNALHTANIAMTLAKQLNFSQHVQDDCYSLGLFRNAGMALISQQRNDYAAIMQQGLQQQQHYSEIEEPRFHTSHEVLGYLIAESWGLSDMLCNVIAYHHSTPLILATENPAEQQRFALLKIAEYFSGESRQLFAVHQDPEWQSQQSAILDVLELEPLQLPELAELLHRQDLHTIYSV
ncbi:HDOD domain-containing protein [Rheinheimera sp. UJ51]|uniref:HDOD domain-containing protein n=1 Tax=Rheinheimera sp. UJ51 TaxID=2892446 RepID=UPI001E6129FD|nr:HDOD domain-containing protein [Rheinheimera sp. UJ51]MCC5450889.1 HDOD domain-containing protein [Rheinheimera sp. UJ51]